MGWVTDPRPRWKRPRPGYFVWSSEGFPWNCRVFGSDFPKQKLEKERNSKFAVGSFVIPKKQCPSRFIAYKVHAML